MTTVRELRERARELGIRNGSRLRKAELLAAIEEALRRIAALGTSASSPTRAEAAPPPAPAPEPAPTRSPRRHPHAGVGPLLGPLALPSLPAAHEVRHLAVIPRNATTALVVWSLTRADAARGPLVLRVFSEHGRVASTEVHERLGRYVVTGLRPDTALWAEIALGREAVAASRRVALPPDGPSRLHHPLVVRIAIDRPLHALPRDLRAGAPVPPPRPADRATASERAWVRAATAPLGEGAPPRVVPDPPALLPPSNHAELVSSLLHARAAE